jgi:hypothetical protein
MGFFEPCSIQSNTGKSGGSAASQRIICCAVAGVAVLSLRRAEDGPHYVVLG